MRRLLYSNGRICARGLAGGTHSVYPKSNQRLVVSSSVFPTVRRCARQQVPGSVPRQGSRISSCQHEHPAPPNAAAHHHTHYHTHVHNDLPDHPHTLCPAAPAAPNAPTQRHLAQHTPRLARVRGHRNRPFSDVKAFSQAVHIWAHMRPT
eukprot:EG_transcript_11570